MKQRILFLILVIVFAISSCNGTRTITGPVTEVKGDTATVNGHRFKIFGNTTAVGNRVTFTETRNRKKINAKKIQ